MTQEHDAGLGHQAGSERPHTSTPSGDELVLHEEQAWVETETHERPFRIRKRLEEAPVQEDIQRNFEEAEVEHAPAAPEDSGEVEVLPDGSISIPVMEEELVVSKRTVVRERIIVHKRIRTEQQRIESTLRREHAEIDASPGNSHGDVREEERAS